HAVRDRGCRAGGGRRRDRDGHPVDGASLRGALRAPAHVLRLVANGGVRAPLLARLRAGCGRRARALPAAVRSGEPMRGCREITAFLIVLAVLPCTAVAQRGARTASADSTKAYERRIEEQEDRLKELRDEIHDLRVRDGELSTRERNTVTQLHG